MKKLLLVIICLFSVGIYAQDAQWTSDFEQAVKIAQDQNKPILVYFKDSQNCDACKKIETTVINNSNFSQIADRVVLVSIDNANDDDATQRKIIHYNNTKTFPSFVTLDSKGSPINVVNEFSDQSIEQYIGFLKQL
ncbi:thioredoxin family protein [Mangrovimonas sp. YM274]|uniref:thioredoxin family protein n=1 Tax=Mangrovimonas sp. YM274 TaxID=3070660 RepID=UPI0027DE9710|nr:thioredoxin family protein [Mangrovimonas sp. YM274]WMI70191.1 thioredoxin family protein [Mangrovimonas sp. YM274]